MNFMVAKFGESSGGVLSSVHTDEGTATRWDQVDRDNISVLSVYVT